MDNDSDESTRDKNNVVTVTLLSFRMDIQA